MGKTLPDGWKTYKIKEIGDVVTGNTPSKRELKNYGGIIVWIKPPDLDKNKYVSSSTETISEIGKEKVRLLPKGSVLVSCIGNIGKVAIAECELCTNQQINSIIPNDKVIDSKFLYYAIKRIRPYLESIASSAVVPLLTKKDFSNIKISIPSLKIQKKIVTILEKVEVLKQQRQESDKLINEYLKSIFYQMFLSKKNYIYKEFGEIVKEFRYGTSNKSGDQGYPVLGIPNVIGHELLIDNINRVILNNSDFDKLQLKKNDILFVRTNGNPNYIGRCGIFDIEKEDYVFASYLIRVRINTEILNPYYLKSYLETPFGRKELISKCRTTAGQYNINTKGLSSVKILLPPLNLQKKYATIVEKAKTMKSFQSNSKKIIDELFNALMQKAFTGELVI